MEIVDSIRDVDAVEDLNSGEDRRLVIREESALSAIELRKASEIEEEVRVQTGNPQKVLFPHPDGLKKDGDDGRSDAFGKVCTKVRKTKPTASPGGVSYIRTVPLRPVPDDVEEVDVYFALRGNYTRFTLREDATQEEVETLGSNHSKGNLCLTEFRPPTEGLNYRFKAMYCRDRENAAWLISKRGDSAEEEWVLFGQELSDDEITRILEDH